MSSQSERTEEELQEERYGVLQQLEDWLETPMILLGALWLVLLIVEFIWGLSTGLERLVTGIWIAFLVDFAIKWILAPHKFAYVKRNWLTALALVLPALRVFRIARAWRALRAARAARGVRLLRIMSSLNRGMRTLGAALGRRGFGYVISLTVIVLFVGAAGMYTFEKDSPTGQGLTTYGTALWWTAMIITTMGTDYWPVTPEGRWLCLFLAIYAFAIFGYITATIATFFIGQDTKDEEALAAGRREMETLQKEMADLRSALYAFRQQTTQKEQREAEKR